MVGAGIEYSATEGAKRPFQRLREARALWLEDAGWSRQLAALVALAEVPWPDSGWFTSEVWVRVASSHAEYVSMSSVGEPDREAAYDAVRTYLRAAESANAHSWATMLRHVLREAKAELHGVAPSGSALVPSGGNLARLERLRSLLDSGLAVPEAAACAFLLVPWLDGVQIPKVLKEFLASLESPASKATTQDLRRMLDKVRQVATECDAVDYVAAADLLLAGLPVADGDDNAVELYPDDSLGQLLYFLEHSSPEEAFEIARLGPPMVDGRHRLGVDYASSVPKSLFSASDFALRLLAEEAHIAADARTLLDAVDFASTRGGRRLRQALSAVRLEVPLDFGARLVEQVGISISSLDDRKRTILERRVLAVEPESLASLGAKFGVTPERIRQLEKRAKQSWIGPWELKPAVSRAGHLLRSALGERVPRSDFDEALKRLIPGDDTSDEVRITRVWVMRQSGYRFTAAFAEFDS